MIIEDLLKNQNELKVWIEENVDSEIKCITLERQIFAFYLLEKLVETGVEFIFKGGTALILLLEQTKRFSTDVDILITHSNLNELESLFYNFVKPDFIFTRFVEDVRENANVPKKHFKFYYNSLYKNEFEEGYILLDAVFQENPYELLVEKQIKNEVLRTKEPYDNVFLPSITDIMIDKLTAFAPRTIGVIFFRLTNNEKKDQSREVVKQWFDINEIYKKCDNFTNLLRRYETLSFFEITKRQLKNITPKNCLADTFECALEYLKGPQGDYELYKNLSKGIKKLDAYVNVNINNDYFIEASVNVVELISKVLCEDVELYEQYVEVSKGKKSYEQFIKEKNLKVAVKKVSFNNKDNRERFIKSLRVIDEILSV